VSNSLLPSPAGTITIEASTPALLKEFEQAPAISFRHDVIADDDHPRPGQQLGAELAARSIRPGPMAMS